MSDVYVKWQGIAPGEPAWLRGGGGRLRLGRWGDGVRSSCEGGGERSDRGVRWMRW